MPKGNPKMFKGFRFNSALYTNFKDLAGKNGYTVTETFEKFMSNALSFGLMFPSDAKVKNIESEARVMLSWLKQNRYWIDLGEGKETSVLGRLLNLLPKIESADLRSDIEEMLKKKL